MAHKITKYAFTRVFLVLIRNDIR